MKPRLFAGLILTCVCVPGPHRGTTAASEFSKNWVLTWSDEFNGSQGARPDATKLMKSGGGT